MDGSGSGGRSRPHGLGLGLRRRARSRHEPGELKRALLTTDLPAQWPCRRAGPRLVLTSRILMRGLAPACPVLHSPISCRPRGPAMAHLQTRTLAGHSACERAGHVRQRLTAASSAPGSPLWPAPGQSGQAIRQEPTSSLDYPTRTPTRQSIEDNVTKLEMRMVSFREGKARKSSENGVSKRLLTMAVLVARAAPQPAATGLCTCRRLCIQQCIAAGRRHARGSPTRVQFLFGLPSAPWCLIRRCRPVRGC